jgi:hypothetical protein
VHVLVRMVRRVMLMHMRSVMRVDDTMVAAVLCAGMRASGSAVASRSETAQCHEAEAGGTQRETRDVEVHRRRRV